LVLERWYLGERPHMVIWKRLEQDVSRILFPPEFGRGRLFI